VRNGIIWLQTLIRAQCRDGSFGTETRCPRHEGNWFSARELVKKDNVAIVKAFQKRLQTVAGFEFIPDPLPMRNGNNACCLLSVFRLAEAGSEKDHLASLCTAEKRRGGL
jgi:hypothetical protein